MRMIYIPITTELKKRLDAYKKKFKELYNGNFTFSNIIEKGLELLDGEIGKKNF